MKSLQKRADNVIDDFINALSVHWKFRISNNDYYKMIMSDDEEYAEECFSRFESHDERAIGIAKEVFIKDARTLLKTAQEQENLDNDILQYITDINSYVNAIIDNNAHDKEVYMRKMLEWRMNSRLEDYNNERGGRNARNSN